MRKRKVSLKPMNFLLSEISLIKIVLFLPCFPEIPGLNRGLPTITFLGVNFLI